MTRKRSTRPALGPSLRVCTHCREPEGRETCIEYHGYHYHVRCAVALCIVAGFEHDPKKWGGHDYTKGPKP